MNLSLVVYWLGFSALTAMAQVRLPVRKAFLLSLPLPPIDLHSVTIPPFSFPGVQPHHPLTSLVAQTLKNLPAIQETRVQSLGWEDPLEKEIATHSSILGWRIPWTEESGGLQSMGSQRVGHD